MLQRGKYDLTIQAQKAIVYAVAQIKPEDTAFKEYEFDLKEFYQICGIERDSYKELKRTLTKLKQKVWWITLEDGHTESAVSWFSKIRISPKSGKVKIKFDEDMMPYLLELSKQHREQGRFYTTYHLKHILPMKSKFSPRLYELLKSYKQNKISWFFELEDLKALLCDNDEEGKPLMPKSWSNFAEFKRRVLDPAVEEINKFTDLNIAYKTEKVGVKVVRVKFAMYNKTKAQLKDVNEEILTELDGEYQLRILKEAEREENDPLEILKRQQELAVAEEMFEDELQAKKERGWKEFYGKKR